MVLLILNPIHSLKLKVGNFGEPNSKLNFLQLLQVWKNWFVESCSYRKDSKPAIKRL